MKGVEEALKMTQPEVRRHLLDRVATALGRPEVELWENEKAARAIYDILALEWEKACVAVKEAEAVFKGDLIPAVLLHTFPQWEIWQATETRCAGVALRLNWKEWQKERLFRALQLLCPENPTLELRYGAICDGLTIWFDSTESYRLRRLHPFTPDNLADIVARWSWHDAKTAARYIADLKSAK